MSNAIIAVFAVLALGGSVWCQSQKQQEPGEPSVIFQVLSTGIGWRLGAKQGSQLSLSQLLSASADGLILDFVSLKCPYSQRQIPCLTQAVKNASADPKTPLVVTVLIDKSETQVREAAKKKITTTPILWDRSRAGVKKFQIKITPTVVVVGKDGQVLASYQGMVPPVEAGYTSFFSTIVKAVASGSPLPPRPMFGMMGPSG